MNPTVSATNRELHMMYCVSKLKNQILLTGVSALASVLPVNTQDCSPLGWTGWISLQSKGLSRVFSNTTVQKYQFFGAQLSLQGSRGCIPGSPGESGLVSRAWGFTGARIELVYSS